MKELSIEQKAKAYDEAIEKFDAVLNLSSVMKTGIELIAEERKRQIEEEGWTKEHDAEHVDSSLAFAAVSYAIPSEYRHYSYCPLRKERVPDFWPWDKKWWKPCPEDRIRELVKAGALIAAEIDRLQERKEK